ncbi:MAG: hypothetical protein RIT22_2046 [Bacteroidota bacterium]
MKRIIKKVAVVGSGIMGWIRGFTSRHCAQLIDRSRRKKRIDFRK